jgi:uncharacterized protein YegP (UPF0339 family)
MADIEINLAGPDFVAEVYRSKAPFRQKWRFRIKARNGQTVAVSEAYHNRRDAEQMARRLVGAVKYPPDSYPENSP